MRTLTFEEIIKALEYMDLGENYIIENFSDFFLERYNEDIADIEYDTEEELSFELIKRYVYTMVFDEYIESKLNFMAECINILIQKLFKRDPDRQIIHTENLKAYYHQCMKENIEIDLITFSDIMRFAVEFADEIYTMEDTCEKEEYINITNIEWDCDPNEEEEIILPSEVKVELMMFADYIDFGEEDLEDMPELVEAISDYLSDHYGWCVEGFNLEKVERKIPD